MQKIQELTLKVTYEVKIKDLECPNNVFNELFIANEGSEKLHFYPNTTNFLIDKINEIENINWECEVKQIITK